MIGYEVVRALIFGGGAGGDRAARALWLYFCTGERATYRSVGEAMGVSKARAGQTIHDGLRKIRYSFVRSSERPRLLETLPPEHPLILEVFGGPPWRLWGESDAAPDCQETPTVVLSP